MTAMTIAYMNEYGFDCADNALAIGIADAIAIEEEERKRYEESLGEEAVLFEMLHEMEAYAQANMREAWEATYDIFSDLSKDIYGYRWRIPRPW